MFQLLSIMLLMQFSPIAEAGQYRAFYKANSTAGNFWYDCTLDLYEGGTFTMSCTVWQDRKQNFPMSMLGKEWSGQWAKEDSRIVFPEYTHQYRFIIKGKRLIEHDSLHRRLRVWKRVPE